MFYLGKNRLTILIDPLTAHLDASHQLIHQQVSLTMILRYLPGIAENKVSVDILFPEYLWDKRWKENYLSFVPGDIDIDSGKKIKIINKIDKFSSEVAKERATKLKKYLESKKDSYLKLPRITLKDPKTLVKSIENGSLLMYRDAEYLYKYRYMELVDLYFQYRVDLLLTSNKVLQAEKKILEEKFKLFPVGYPEIFEEVETFLKGHHIYISHEDPIYGLGISTFYPVTDLKLRKYFELWRKIIEIKKDARINEYFRRMFYHRYSFMMYAIDQIKFQIFQANRLQDNKLRANHYFLASYHLNNFYFILWGFLDNLAWIFNYLFDLGFDDKTKMKCTFLNKDYRKRLRIKAPQVLTLLQVKEVNSWLSKLAVKRHPAAHREPLFLTHAYDERDMSLISERMIVIEEKSKKLIFEAINHLNYDIKQFDCFMDRVCKLFEV